MRNSNKSHFLNELVSSKYVEIISGPIDFDQVGQAICAFANGDGGTIVLGVNESGEVIGLDDTDAIAERLGRMIRSSLSPSALVTITPVTSDEAKIITIGVASGTRRPYTWKKAIYTRRKNKISKASGANITKLLTSPRPYLWGQITAMGMNLDDIDDSEVLNTWMKYSQTYPWVVTEVNPVTTFNILDHFHLLDSGQINNAAVVLFGKAPQILFPQTRVRATVFSDQSDDVYLDKAIYEGHLFYLLESILNFLSRYLSISSEISDKSISRYENLEVPFVVLREAILNALQHRDYEAFDGGISVSIRPSCIEIWNSGQLPDGMKIADLMKRHSSRPRNPLISYVLASRGYIEQLGTGVQRMVKNCLEAGLPEPVWELNSGGVLVRIRRNEPFKTDLGERHIYLINHVSYGESITAPEVSSLLNVSDRQARSYLKELTEFGFFKKRGKARATHYVRTSMEI